MKIGSVIAVVLAVAIALASIAFVRNDRVEIVTRPAPPLYPSHGSGPGAPRIHVVDYLPAGFVTNGTADYSTAVREAIADAAGGVLVLPSFPVRVSRAQGQAWCLLVDEPLAIEGSPSSALVETAGRAQIVRVADVVGFTMRDVTLRGCGSEGQGLAHGLLQVSGGGDIVLERIRIDSSDADGIAVAGAHDVRITGCLVERASKAGLYVSTVERATLTGNVVTRFGGHRTPSGFVVGAGIQISSSSDVVCSGNVVRDGTGVGILCNALEGGGPPVGCVIDGNRIVSVSNPANNGASGGIRLQNGSGEGRAQTSVTGNSIRGCGQFGVYVENHHGASVQQNTIAESERCGIVIATVQDAFVIDNVVLNSGTTGLAGFHQIQLINGAARAIVRGNVLRDVPGYEGGAARDTVLDSSSGGGHTILP